MIYLAAPYSAPHAACPSFIEDLRYRETLYTSALLTSRGHFVCTPTVLGHVVDQATREANWPSPSHEWWLCWSQELLAACDALWVLCLDGWQDSKGIAREIAWAKEQDLPIVCIDREGNWLEVSE